MLRYEKKQIQMVSIWCQANLKTLENKGEMIKMKLGIEIYRAFSYNFIKSHKTP